MAFSVADVEEFLGVLRQHPEWRERMRDELVSDDMRALPGIVRRLAEAQERTEARLDAFTAAVQELAEAQRRTEERLELLIVRVDKWAGKTGNLEGQVYEFRWVRHAPAHIGRFIRRAREVSPLDIPELDDALSTGALTASQWDELRQLDVLITGTDRRTNGGPAVYAAVERSMTIDERDVARAARRADLIRRFGLNVQAFVGGQKIVPAAIDLAQRLDVTVVVDSPEPADAA